MSKISRRAFVGGSVAAATILSRGVAWGQTKPDRVKIAGSASVSGAAAAFCRPGVNAWKLAVDNLNNAGGLWGDGKGLVDLEVLDDKTTPATSVENISRIASDASMPFALNVTATPSTLQGSVEAERQKITFFNTASSEPTVNTRGLEYAFSTNPPAGVFVLDHLTGTKELFDKRGIKPERVAFVHENKLAGPSVRKVWDENASQILGWNIVDYFGYDPATKDLTPVVAQLKSANIDLAILYGFPGDVILLVDTMRSLDFNPLAMTGPFGGLETNAFAKALGKGANHVMGSGYYAPDLKIDETAKFVKQYNEAHGEVPDGVAASCYQGIHAAFEGLRKAGTIDREAFREAVRSVDLKVGDTGIIIPPGIKFNETGANENARSVYYRWMDGQKQTLLPAEYAAVEPVIPRPQWSEIQ